MALTEKAHGGHCCGVSHLFDFPVWSESVEKSIALQIENTLSEWEYNEYTRRDGTEYKRLPSHLFEIVLTDEQLMDDNKAWVPALKRLGFRHVARWFNSNSDNYCNMFVWNRKAPVKAPWKG